MSALISGRSLLMTATNGDLLYTKILKKEKGNSSEDLSRRRIHSRLSFIYLYFFWASLCLSYFSLLYFQYMYSFILFFLFEHNNAQPIPADSGPIIKLLKQFYLSLILIWKAALYWSLLITKPVLEKNYFFYEINKFFISIIKGN